MPNIEEHCKQTLKRYRVEGRDIHQWLDEPSRKYASGHRQFRHDTETIRLVGENFGKSYGKSLAETIALDHIMLDHEEEIKSRRTVVLKFPEKKEIPSIPCSYCGILLKPSDQACPNCGANRKRIIEEFDRAYEMEKIKLQEKRKELRKQLKHEYELTKMSPEERISLKKIMAYPDLILDELIQEDFKRHPELKQKLEREKKIKNGIIAFLLSIWLIPGFLLSLVNLEWGIAWFIGGILLFLFGIFLLFLGMDIFMDLFGKRR